MEHLLFRFKNFLLEATRYSNKLFSLWVFYFPLQPPTSRIREALLPTRGFLPVTALAYGACASFVRQKDGHSPPIHSTQWCKGDTHGQTVQIPGTGPRFV
jgi:hypothetical protein